jgi:hypothetical protein
MQPNTPGKLSKVESLTPGQRDLLENSLNEALSVIFEKVDPARKADLGGQFDALGGSKATDIAGNIREQLAEAIIIAQEITDRENFVRSNGYEAFISYLGKVDSNGLCCFEDSINDSDTLEDMKEVVLSAVQYWTESEIENSENMPEDHKEFRRGSFEALHRASYFNTETFLAQLGDTVKQALKGQMY